MKKFKTEVVGLQYRITQSTRNMIKDRIAKDGPIEVLLVREPDNPADENAIKVVIRSGAYKQLHIGYLKRNVAGVYAKALDTRVYRVIESAHITGVNVDAGTAPLEIRLAKSKPRKKTKKP